MITYTSHGGDQKQIQDDDPAVPSRRYLDVIPVEAGASYALSVQTRMTGKPNDLRWSTLLFMLSADWVQMPVPDTPHDDWVTTSKILTIPKDYTRGICALYIGNVQIPTGNVFQMRDFTINRIDQGGGSDPELTFP